MDHKQLILKHLKDIYVMQLATAKDGRPWACNVHFYVDDRLHFYWLSSPATRHSQDIAANPHAAVVVAVHAQPPLIGVQIEGEAKQCDPKVHQAALHAYAERHGRGTWVTDVLKGKGGLKMYRLVPDVLSVFDQKNFPESPKQVWRQ